MSKKPSGPGGAKYPSGRKGTQTEDLPLPFSNVAKIVEDALSRNGYHIKVSIKTDQKAIYVTERKVSPLPRLSPRFTESICAVSSCTSLERHPAQRQGRLRKTGPGGRILSVSAEEVAEIERSLIREINKAPASPGKT